MMVSQPGGTSHTRPSLVLCAVARDTCKATRSISRHPRSVLDSLFFCRPSPSDRDATELPLTALRRRQAPQETFSSCAPASTKRARSTPPLTSLFSRARPVGMPAAVSDGRMVGRWFVHGRPAATPPSRSRAFPRTPRHPKRHLRTRAVTTTSRRCAVPTPSVVPHAGGTHLRVNESATRTPRCRKCLTHTTTVFEASAEALHQCVPFCRWSAPHRYPHTPPASHTPLCFVRLFLAHREGSSVVKCDGARLLSLLQEVPRQAASREAAAANARREHRRERDSR